MFLRGRKMFLSGGKMFLCGGKMFSGGNNTFARIVLMGRYYRRTEVPGEGVVLGATVKDNCTNNALIFFHKKQSFYGNRCFLAI